MGCQSDVIIGNNLVFTCVTHDPDTGIATDADAAPAYRVYENETESPILTGNMAKLDDANTTGFYSELIACTVANGFEVGKSYNILITATVDSDAGGISYAFTVKPDDNAVIAKIWKAMKNKLYYNKATDHMILYDDDDSATVLDHTMVDSATEATRGRGA